MDLLSHTLTIGSRGAVVLAKFFRLEHLDTNWYDRKMCHI